MSLVLDGSTFSVQTELASSCNSTLPTGSSQTLSAITYSPALLAAITQQGTAKPGAKIPKVKNIVPALSLAEANKDASNRILQAARQRRKAKVVYDTSEVQNEDNIDLVPLEGPDSNELKIAKNGGKLAFAHVASMFKKSRGTTMSGSIP